VPREYLTLTGHSWQETPLSGTVNFAGPAPCSGASRHAYVLPDGPGETNPCWCAAAARISTKLGNHSFRATGITVYLKYEGTLEKAAAMANHASTRTTQLYDRRREEMTLDEVERIRM
jgi:hypothetical protein